MLKAKRRRAIKNLKIRMSVYNWNRVKMNVGLKAFHLASSTVGHPTEFDILIARMRNQSIAFSRLLNNLYNLDTLTPIMVHG